MRTIALIAVTAALASGPAVQSRELTGEARLAKILEGRVAGEPVNCINLRGGENTRIVDRTAIVYGSGKTIYVNRPTGANSLNSTDILVVRRTGPQLCSVDTVQLRDNSSGLFSGFVGLNEFVPYRLVARD